MVHCSSCQIDVDARPKSETYIAALFISKVLAGLVGLHPLFGCGSKNRYPKWNPGRWKHKPKPAVCPPWLILSHTLLAGHTFWFILGPVLPRWLSHGWPSKRFRFRRSGADACRRVPQDLLSLGLSKEPPPSQRIHKTNNIAEFLDN